jgi:DNA modification methylase
MRATIIDALTPLAVPVDNLTPDPNNANVGDVAAIRRSLTVFGQRKPVVVRQTGQDSAGRPTGIIIAGNHTFKAALELGWDHIAAAFSADDETTAKAYALADNRTGELASWDDVQLAATLRELSGEAFDMESLGWSADDLAALLRGKSAGGVGSGVALTDPDDAPDVPVVPVSTLGDLWLLGPHRVLCGDALDAVAVETMLGGNRADCMWTDPPYGVEYVGKTKEALTIKGDGAAGLSGLLAGAFTVATAALGPGAAVYVAHPAGALHKQFIESFLAVGWSFRQGLVWVKDSMVLGHSDYHYRHEPILYGFTPGGEGRLGRGGDRWHGDHSQTTVFEVARPSRSEAHPTMKPVALVSAMLANSCSPGGLVYDPFGGSGSTLLAAHATGRVAALVELEPAYVDVICRRYQEHTGVKPILAATGEPHDFTEGVA